MLFALSLLLTLFDSRHLPKDSYLSTDCEQNPSLIAGEVSIKHLTAANRQFAFNLQKSLPGNAIWSPMSVFTGMGMLYTGARGATAREIRQALSYDAAGLNCDDMKQQFRYLLNSYVYEDGKGGLVLANAVILQKEYPILPEYKNDLEHYYGASAKEMDLRKSKEVVKEANTWVSEKTHGKIPRLLKSLDDDTVLLLLNAAYFKGLWKAPFNERFTHNGEFYNNGSIAISVPTMAQDSKLLYGKFPEYSLSALKLPYQGDRFSMIVLLPFERKGLWTVEDKIRSNTLERIMLGLREEYVLVKLPKFKLENQWKLKNHFHKLGITTAFTNKADLSGISSEKKLKVSKIIHHAMVEVNETGTGASAATSLAFSPRALSENFFVEHPFLFLIMDETTGMIIFSGRVVEL